MREHGRLGSIEWAMAARPKPGEDDCGDRSVALDAGDAALFGVIDGLGHGTAASLAARRAAGVLIDNPAEPLDVLILLCHRALTETRGAAVSLALMGMNDRDKLRWVGVGNVNACLVESAPGGLAARASALLSAGIVGYQLPSSMQTQTLSMRQGDLLVMTSDGIRADFLDAVDLAKPAAQIAEDILTGHAKNSDDALVVTARRRGAPS